MSDLAAAERPVRGLLARTESRERIDQLLAELRAAYRAADHAELEQAHSDAFEAAMGAIRLHYAWKSARRRANGTHKPPHPLSERTTMSELYKMLGGSTQENNLAEEYAGAVDLFSRLAGAIEGGSLRYAWEKAADLRRQLERFESRLQNTEIDPESGEPVTRYTGSALDGQKVAAAAVAFAQQYRAGKLLHQVDQIKDEAVKAELRAGEDRAHAFRDELGV